MPFVAASTRRSTISRLRARRVALATAAVAACLAAATAFAAGATGDPDLRAMALGPGDFAPGAKVVSEHMKPGSGPIVSVFERSFGPGVRLAGPRLLVVTTTIALFRDSGSAALTFGEIQRTLQSPTGRSGVAKDFAAAVGSGTLRVKSVSVGAPIPLGLAQGSLKLPITLRTSLGRLEVALDVLVLDRALGVVVVAALPRAHLLASDPQRAATSRPRSR
jgi:hypothetical protein